MVCLRRSNAARIAATAARSPDTAVSAAACDTLATLERQVALQVRGGLDHVRRPIIQPTRQPVIA